MYQKTIRKRTLLRRVRRVVSRRAETAEADSLSNGEVQRSKFVQTIYLGSLAICCIRFVDTHPLPFIFLHKLQQDV